MRSEYAPDVVSIALRWGLEGYTSKLNNGISATYAAEAYIDEAEGEAGEIAKLLAQDVSGCWAL